MAVAIVGSLAGWLTWQRGRVHQRHQVAHFIRQRGGCVDTFPWANPEHVGYLLALRGLMWDDIPAMRVQLPEPTFSVQDAERIRLLFPSTPIDRVKTVRPLGMKVRGLTVESPPEG